MGYSIGCRRGRGSRMWHASVRIDYRLFRETKARLERLALQRSVDELSRELRLMPFEAYAPVRDQLWILLRAINRRRRAAGLELLPNAVVGWRRVPVRPFEGPGD